MSRVLPEKIYSLDVLRGLAALAVVFWHWQHFFYFGNAPKDFQAERQPFYYLFSLLYKHGDAAVELFFCISGFIFYWLYSSDISKRKISAKKFTLNRISRLYPLYILTFFVVFILQVVYKNYHNLYFVYQDNDLYHAMLNILMIPAWGFETGWSFNAPVWSVSIEVMLYGIFFLSCLFGRLRLSLIPVFILMGYVIFTINYKIGIGIFSFFCGAATYIFTQSLIKVAGQKTHFITLFVVITTWTTLIYFEVNNIFLVTAFGFTSIISFFTTLSTNPSCNKLFLRLRWIGDMSYSSYLIHFPLQITFALCADALGYSRDVFYSTQSMVLFMAVLIPLSLLTHYQFEARVQKYIRNKAMHASASQSILKQG
jgi:peptidoglycan/LPS O-acetylase OafA/YrhL